MVTLPSSGVRRISSTLHSPPGGGPVGVLIHKDHHGKELGRKKIYANREIVIGRDKSRCQYILNDPFTSKRHLRIYTVVYENDEPNEIDTLVYAEDLSQNGTYWNGSFIGKGNGGFLLTDEDVLRLSRQTYFVFTATSPIQTIYTFDHTQEMEMKNFRKDYILTDRLLGTGAFGRVHMAVEQNAKYQVACKVVDLRPLMPGRCTRFRRPDQPAAAQDVDSRQQIRKVKAWGNQQKREDALERQLSKYLREVEILSSICHPNVIAVEKVYITDNTLYIMQDIITAGDLFSYIESKNGKLIEVEAAVIIRQILIAIAFLHNKNIVHRDIKPDNVLMTSLAAGCRVILTDFGAARRIENKLHRMSSVIGTHEYAAPEILGYLRSNLELERPGYTRAVDMWAIGCVSVVLLTGGLAFCDPVTCVYSEKLARDCNLDFLHQSKEWKTVRPRPKEFVERLLVFDEDARMTAEQALEHSWFYNEVHKNDFEDLYQRTIKHWRPRMPKLRLVEFQDSGVIGGLVHSKDVRDPSRRNSLRVQNAVEPPYKPFPRHMHSKLWPKRNPNGRLSEEVLSNIEKSFPSSAALLRTRSQSRSPARGLPTSIASAPATIQSSSRSRAISEPPLWRPFTLSTIRATDFPRESAARARFFRDTNSAARPTSRAGEPLMRAILPQWPRKHLDVPSTFESDFDLSSNQQGSAISPDRDLISRTTGHVAGVGISSPNTPVPKINVEGPTENIKLVFKNDEMSSSVEAGTPPRSGRLKRRISTASPTPRSRKHRGPVFELAEDDDSDESAEFTPRPGSVFDFVEGKGHSRITVPRQPLVSKSGADTVTRSTQKVFYLPR